MTYSELDEVIDTMEIMALDRPWKDNDGIVRNLYSVHMEVSLRIGDLMLSYKRGGIHGTR